MSDVRTQVTRLAELTPDGRDRLLGELLALARRNVEAISREFIAQRLERYNYLVTARDIEDGRLLGFGTSKLSRSKFRSIFPARLMHLGLMVVDARAQGRHVSRVMGEALFWKMWRMSPVSVSLFGIFCSGKCSSPASYTAFLRKSRGFCVPRIVTREGDAGLRHSRLAETAADRFRQFLDLEGSGFVLKGVNRDAAFVLGRKNFEFDGPDRRILSFFEREVFPDSELLTVVWYHPVLSLLT